MSANPEFYIEEHAVLYALMVKEARACGDVGEAASVEATCRYGRERGGRMAKRALRDGKKLTMQTYTQYGEWVDSKGWSKSKVSALSPVYTTDAIQCGWCDSWKKHDLLKDGKLYCEYIDYNLVKGFNSENELTITSVLSRGEESCHFVWNGVSFDSEEAVKQNIQEKSAMANRNLKDFLYHTAHLFASMKATFAEMLGEDKAQVIAGNALTRFEELFGGEKTEALTEAAMQDFTTV